MTLTTVPTEVERDGWGRPKIIPPGGGKPVAYTRATTVAKALDDTSNLQKWGERMVALGLVGRPDLHLAVAAHAHDKTELNRICSAAKEAAQATAAATTGTAMHALTERMDRGLDVGAVPAAYLDDLRAYEKATAGFEHLLIEELVVCDEHLIAGTPDRISLWEGRPVVVDLKTSGSSIEFGFGAWSLQLAIYAHSLTYDTTTGARGPLADGIDWTTAVVVHLPAGQGTCDLYELDIAAGWADVATAMRVRAVRREGKKRAKKITPTSTRLPAPPTATPTVDEATPPASGETGSQHHRAQMAALVASYEGPPTEEELADRVAHADTSDAIAALYAANKTGWTPHVRDVARARKALLDGGLV